MNANVRKHSKTHKNTQKQFGSKKMSKSMNANVRKHTKTLKNTQKHSKTVWE